MACIAFAAGGCCAGRCWCHGRSPWNVTGGTKTTTPKTKTAPIPCLRFASGNGRRCPVCRWGDFSGRGRHWPCRTALYAGCMPGKTWVFQGAGGRLWRVLVRCAAAWCIRRRKQTRPLEAASAGFKNTMALNGGVARPAQNCQPCRCQYWCSPLSMPRNRPGAFHGCSCWCAGVSSRLHRSPPG